MRKRWKLSVVQFLILKRERKKGNRMRRGRSGLHNVLFGRSFRRKICSKKGYYEVELTIYVICTKSLS